MEKITLAQARTSSDVGRVERTYPLCIARKLTAAYESLAFDIDELEAERAELRPPAPPDGDDSVAASGDQGPKRLVPRGGARVAEIDALLAEKRGNQDELAEKMDAYTKDLVLRAIEPHEWTAFVDEHPARDPEEPAGKRDRRVTFGFCDSDALIADLARYTVAWGDEELGATDWADTLYPASSPQTLRSIAQLVVLMHEDEAIVPKLPSASSPTGASETPSESPETQA